MFAQIMSAVHNGLSNLKASCQQAFPTIDHGLLENVRCLCMSMAGSLTLFRGFECHLAYKQIIEHQEFVFICWRVWSCGNADWIKSHDAGTGQKQQQAGFTFGAENASGQPGLDILSSI